MECGYRISKRGYESSMELVEMHPLDNYHPILVLEQGGFQGDPKNKY